MDDVDMHLSRCHYLIVKVRGAAEMPSPDEAAIEGNTGSRPSFAATSPSAQAEIVATGAQDQPATTGA